MTIDEQAMASVFEDAFLPFVIEQHGEQAGPAIRSILTFIRGFYKHVSPEGQNEKIVVFQSLDPAARPIGKIGVECTSLTELVNKVVGPCAIQVIPSGIFIIWAKHSIDPANLSANSVVYSFHQGIEHFHANKKSKRVRLFWIFRFTGYDGGFASAKAAYDSSFLLTSFSEPRRPRWDEVGANGTVLGTR